MIVIRFDRVAKWYPYYPPILAGLKTTLLHLPTTLASLKRRRLAALSDVSFAIRQGEAVGFVGANGSGKSTTLALIANVLRPSAGRVEVQGRVGALLELGAGFHPELSGRENIILNGVLFGLTRREVSRKADEIIAFSDLEPFLDQPLRTYSSGMVARLGFSVVAHLDPEILVIDEVLAVGDLQFQAKCRRKIDEFRQRGVTIVLVSHSTDEVLRLCDRVIWLSEGRIASEGEPSAVLKLYEDAAVLRCTVVGARTEAEPSSANEPATGEAFTVNSQSNPATRDKESRAHDRDDYQASGRPGPDDGRDPQWLELAGRIADRVVAEIRPRRVLDVGHAQSLLVDALRDRGVVAFGIDVPAYAAGEVRPNPQPDCHAGVATGSLDHRYDLIICLDIPEHISEEEGRQVIANICRSTEDVLFSAAPNGLAPLTHLTAQPPAYWIEQFAVHGFEPDGGFDASFIAPHAMRLRLSEQARLQRRVKEQDRLFADLSFQLADKERVIAELSFHLLALQQTIGWKLLERLRRTRDRFIPPGSRRRHAYWAFRRVFQVLLDEGLGAVLSKTAYKVRAALRGQGLLVKAPWEILPLDLNVQYRIWLQRHRLTPRAIAQTRGELATFTYTPLVSLVTPVHDPEETWLRQTVESVRAQVYPHWELCLANDASTEPHVKAILDEYAALDPRIRVIHLVDNEGIAGASNRALDLATGEFVGLLDHDDELSQDALFEVVKRLNEDPTLDLVYSDEDKLAADGARVDPFFKPDWSPDLLLSMNYIAHFIVFRRGLLIGSGGFRPGFDGSQDYDLLLRVTERTDKIAHIPRILYHWRKSPGSAAASPSAKPAAYEAGRSAIADALRRRGSAGSVEHAGAGRYLVRYRLHGTPLVSIIVPTRDRWQLLRQCLRSIEEKTDYPRYEIIVLDNDSVEPETRRYLEAVATRWPVWPCPGPFNFSTINNVGAAQAKGEYLLFLNNDTQAMRPDWLTAMLEHAQRPEIGAVGAKLLYPGGGIQHAGVVLGIGGVAGHAFKHLPPDATSYFDLADIVRDCAAVTGACMMVRRKVFEEVGGFDERFKVAFNDVDLCLRIQRRGYRIIYTPLAVLYHHESATRGRVHPSEDDALAWRLWGDVIRAGDKYYNPNLSSSHEDWSLRL